MNDLLRELAPISDDAWKAIDDEARQTLTVELAGRKLVDFVGPRGWKKSARSVGRVTAIADAPAEGVTAAIRQVQPLVELRAPFSLSRTELDTFFTDVKAGKVQDVQWMPDQKGAMFESKVAESAGELDPLRPAGSEGRGRELLKDYMRISLDEAKNVPTLVSHMLSAADLHLRHTRPGGSKMPTLSRLSSPAKSLRSHERHVHLHPGDRLATRQAHVGQGVSRCGRVGARFGRRGKVPGAWPGGNGYPSD